jgi:glutamate-1-semialdehyde 2,1-aminomutase
VPTQTATPPCPRCRRVRESYWYLGLYEYDVDMARRFVSDGREPVEVEEDCVRESVEKNELDEQHVLHVDPSFPGVIAHVRYETDDGEILKGHVLIDGHHRAARCLREERTFQAYLLTEDESQAVILRRPNTLPRVRRGLLGKDGEPGPQVPDRHRLGEQERFLLAQLNGRHDAKAICAAFSERFGKPMSREEFNAFLCAAQSRRWLAFTELPDCREDLTDDAGVRAYEAHFADSGKIYERAQNVIAGATTHDRREFGPFPIYVDHAAGARKWDVGGRPLIDYWMGHGALLMGHDFAPVVEAVAGQVTRGTHFGACHESEVRWAELVCQMIPSAQRVRFTASGTEATLLAHRIARAYTGRNLVVKFERHFHGWHDEAMAHFFSAPSAGFSAGSLSSVMAVSSLEAVVALLEQGDVAAVILEPGGGSAGALPWSRESLQSLRQATEANDSLLIFDEVITGFRVCPGGVQQIAGVLPDLTTLAKILCGGLPGGAVAGRAEVMAVFGSGTRRDDRWVQVPHTGTFNGNPLSAAAGIAMLEHIADGAAQETARRAADRLVEQVNQAAEAGRVDVHLYNGDTSIFHMLIGARRAGLPLGPSDGVTRLHREQRDAYAKLRRALLVEGVDTHPVHGWVSAVHDEKTIAATAAAFERAFHFLRPTPAFAL